MDILYIVGKNCSKCEDNELRFSLRSLEKYGTNVGKVYVVGYCPEWLSEQVVKIPVQDNFKHAKNDGLIHLKIKHANITNALLYAIDNSDIGDEFLVSMDDHIYVRQTDFDNYPFYIKQYEQDNCLPSLLNANNVYKFFLTYTRTVCKNQKLSFKYFTLHRNMHISRKIINECRPTLEKCAKGKQMLEPWAYMLNYRYTHYKDFKPVIISDIKVKDETQTWKIKSASECFSTKDFEKNSELDNYIKKLFPNKSKYEK